MVLEAGVLPDIIVADSSTAILSMFERTKRRNPNLIWVVGAFHISHQLNKALGKMRWGRTTTYFVPCNLQDRLSSYAYLSSKSTWWPSDELAFEDALDFLTVFPQGPSGEEYCRGENPKRDQALLRGESRGLRQH